MNLSVISCANCIHVEYHIHGRQLYCNYKKTDVTNSNPCKAFIDRNPLPETRNINVTHGTAYCDNFKWRKEKLMNEYQKEITKNINNINEITIEKKMIFTVANCEMDRATFFELMGEFITDDESEKTVNGICDFIETMEASIPYNTKVIILTPENHFDKNINICTKSYYSNEGNRSQRIY